MAAASNREKTTSPLVQPGGIWDQVLNSPAGRAFMDANKGQPQTNTPGAPDIGFLANILPTQPQAAGANQQVPQSANQRPMTMGMLPFLLSLFQGGGQQQQGQAGQGASGQGTAPALGQAGPTGDPNAPVPAQKQQGGGQQKQGGGGGMSGLQVIKELISLFQ